MSLVLSCANGNSSHEINGKVTIEETPAPKPEWESLGSVTGYSFEWFPVNLKTGTYEGGWVNGKTVSGTLYSKESGSHMLYQFRMDSQEYAVAKYSGEFNYNATFSIGNTKYYLNVPSW